jgi:hypothetical protein
MMTLTAVFWMYVILFGVIGGFRGWAKELLVIFSVLLAIAIDTVLLTYVDSVRIIMTSRPGITQFALRAGLLLTMAYFGYQTPNLPAFASGKFAREKLQDLLLGVALGLINGYFIAGSIWFYMHQANYPLPYVTPPADPNVAVTYMKYMPPILFGIPNIYFAIIAAFVFVIIVFV